MGDSKKTDQGQAEAAADASASACQRTPLYAQHVAASARMVPFAGWEMPVQYSSIVEEHHAVRQAAGLFDVSHMGEILISGARAEAACMHIFSNDASRLEPGRAQYTLIPNELGGLVDDVILYRLATDSFLVCVNASNAARDLAWIQARAGEGARVEDLSSFYALMAVQGPNAAAVVASVLPCGSAEIAEIKRFSFIERSVLGAASLVARTGYTGEDGFEMFVPAGAAPEIWAALLDHGEAHGLVPVGLGARDTLRLEAALPLYGNELGEDTSPFSAGLGWVVRRDLAGLCGGDALAAARASAPDAGQRLVGLLPERGIARHGHDVFVEADADSCSGSGSAGASGTDSGSTDSGGSVTRPVGCVTSGTHSPTLGRPIALAYVDAAVVESGVALCVEIRGKRRRVVGASLPFYASSRDSAG